MFMFPVPLLKLMRLVASYVRVRCPSTETWPVRALLLQRDTNYRRRKHERYASICIDLTDVRSVAEYLLWFGEGHNSPRAKQATENNIPGNLYS